MNINDYKIIDNNQLNMTKTIISDRTYQISDGDVYTYYSYPDFNSTQVTNYDNSMVIGNTFNFKPSENEYGYMKNTSTKDKILLKKLDIFEHKSHPIGFQTKINDIELSKLKDNNISVYLKSFRYGVEQSYYGYLFNADKPVARIYSKNLDSDNFELIEIFFNLENETLINTIKYLCKK